MAANGSNEFKFTSDELNRLGDAFKDEKFRKLFFEYAEEINDPENQRKYEEDIAALEKERGINTTFIHPEGGYVLKTTINGERKAFLNICKNKHVGKASCSRAQKNQTSGYSWNIPYFMSQPREDLDKSGKLCTVYDIIFHPDTFYMAEKNANFRKMIEETALAGVGDKFNVVVDKKNVRRPKLKFKGRAVPTVIRTKIQNGHDPSAVENNDLESVGIKIPYPYPPASELNAESKSVHIIEKSGKSDENLATTPKYSIKYRNHVDIQDYSIIPNTCASTRPNEIVIEIDLPLLDSTDGVELEIFQKRLFLKSDKEGARYLLDLNLAYPVDENNGKAKFDKNKRKLTVILPVVPIVLNMTPSNGEDAINYMEVTNSEVDKLPLPHSVDEHEDLLAVENVQDAGDNTHLNEVHEDLAVMNGNVQISSDEFKSTSICKNSHKCKIDSLCVKQNGYFFPEFQCNQTQSILAFVLQVKNVEPVSVQIAYCDCHSAYQVTFSSIGEGFVPFLYSFCLKFEIINSFIPKDCSVNVTENNVVVKLIKKEECMTLWPIFWVGANSTILQKYEALSESLVMREMKELKDEAENLTQNGELLCGDQVTFGDVNLQHISFNVQLETIAESSVEEVTTDTNEEEEDAEKDTISFEDRVSPSATKPLRIPGSIHQNLTDSGSDDLSSSIGDRPLKLTLSNAEDQGPSQRKRGILKYPRNWRTMSESSDDMCFSPLDTPSIEIDSMLELVSEDQEDKPKKSVRFSDQVARNVFRTNSSILGQRKKNQRKARNKKKKSPTKSNEGSDSAESETWDSGEGSDCNSVSEADTIETSQNTVLPIKDNTKRELCASRDAEIPENEDCAVDDNLKMTADDADAGNHIKEIASQDQKEEQESSKDSTVSQDIGSHHTRSRRERRQAKKKAKWEKKNGKRNQNAKAEDRTIKENSVTSQSCTSLVEKDISLCDVPVKSEQNDDLEEHETSGSEEQVTSSSHEEDLEVKDTKSDLHSDSMLSWDEEDQCKSDLQTACAIDFSNSIMFQLD